MAVWSAANTRSKKRVENDPTDFNMAEYVSPDKTLPFFATIHVPPEEIRSRSAAEQVSP
jgi:hypothetical protein